MKLKTVISISKKLKLYLEYSLAPSPLKAHFFFSFFYEKRLKTVTTQKSNINLSANHICAGLLFGNSFPNTKTVSNMEKTASKSVSHAYSDSFCHL